MEPERPIEKLLRAFAKKRREQAGAPMELHSAMRQQLRKEIARRAASPTGGAEGWFLSLFATWRARFVFALCFTGLLILGLTWWLPPLTHPKTSKLASADALREPMTQTEKNAPALQPPPPSTLAPAGTVEGTRVGQDKQPASSGTLAMATDQLKPAAANRSQLVVSAEVAKKANVPKSTFAATDTSTGVTVASTPPVPKETFDFKANEIRTTSNASGGVASLNKDAVVASQPPVDSALATRDLSKNSITVAANGEAEQKLKGQIQSFAPASAGASFLAQSKSESAQGAPGVSLLFNRADVGADRRRAMDGSSSAVLVSFRVEQNGNGLRVVDADGSVYTGAVRFARQNAASRVDAPKNTPALAQAAKSASASESVRDYFFRVSGTNHNLKQNVVFSGNFIPLTNAPQVIDDAAFGGAGGAQPQPGGPPNTLLLNSRISGTAVIGNQKEIQVIATPAP